MKNLYYYVLFKESISGFFGLKRETFEPFLLDLIHIYPLVETLNM